jgi:hypothetical protein
MPFLLQGQSVDLTVPQGQSVAVGASRNAVANVLVPVNAWRGGPWQTVTNTNAVIGPLVVGATVRIFAASGTVEYAQGTAPQVSDSAVVYPSGGDDSAIVQAAARSAALAGVELVLGPGDFLFNSAGINADTGFDEYAGTPFANRAWRGLEIQGAGIGRTRIRMNVAGAAFRWHAGGLSGTTQYGIGISGMSIFGTGIGSGVTGIQMGGVSTTKTDLCERAYIRDILIDNVTTGIILDDVTNLEYSQLNIRRFKYAWEFGYNVDTVRGIAQYGFNAGELTNVTVTVTNGSNSITVPAATAALLQVGYAISCPSAFPAETYVGSIVGTTITAVNYRGIAVNASASAVVADFMFGRVFNYGARLLDTLAGTLYPQYGSPFVSPFWSQSNAATRGRVNANQHDHFGPAGGVETIADIGGASHFDLTFRIYQERTCAGYIIGDAASTLQARKITIEKCYIGTPEKLVRPWVHVPVSAADCDLTIRDNTCDFSTMTQYWCSIPTFGSNMGLAWENNNLPSSGATPSLIAGSNNPAFASVPILSKNQYFYIGSKRAGDGIPARTGVTGGVSWLHYGQDGLQLALTGNATLNNPADGPYRSTGKAFTVLATTSGAFTLAFGTLFLNTAGAALGTVAAGAAGQKLSVTFTWDGNYYRAMNTPTWNA